MHNAYVNADLSFGYIDGLNAIVKTGTGSGGLEPGIGTTISIQKPQGGGEVANWGDDNLFPQQIVADTEINTSLPTMLSWKAKAWYGGGLIYGTVNIDEQGEEVFKRVRIPQVEDFLKANNLPRFAFEAAKDLSYFANAFIEVILSRNRQSIVHVAALDACYCRYSKATSPTDLMKYVYVNANWANGGRFDDEYATKIPVLDVYYNKVESLRARTDGFKYIYPINIPSPDKSDYQMPDWNTFRRSGWADVAKAVVEFKKMLLKQILSVEFIIEVHPAYWEWKYKDWDEKNEEERRRLITAELKNFGEVMSGSNGAGKSLMTTTVKDSSGADVSAFKVTAIDKKRSDNLNEDSQEAASHAYTAGGVAPTLMGIQPGKNMGAGSGSDARVAFNNFISTSTFEQDLILEVLHFVRDYNGWPENLEFRFKQPLIMTMDKGKQVQQQTS